MRLASLMIFFATGTMIGMEQKEPRIIIDNQAWSYLSTAPSLLGGGEGYYDIQIKVNDSPEEIKVEGGKSIFLGNLADINKISIRRSGLGTSWFSKESLYSVITKEELDPIKQEAADNPKKDVRLFIGAQTEVWRVTFGIYRYDWVVQVIGSEPPKKIDKENAWSMFPAAMQEKDTYGPQFTFSTNAFSKANSQGKQRLIRVAKLVLGYTVNDTPSFSEIKKRYYEMARSYHPDKKRDLTASLMIDKFAEEMFKIIHEAYEILGEAHKENLL